MPKCHCLDRNATERGVCWTRGGRNICLHFLEPMAAAATSSSSPNLMADNSQWKK